MVGGTIFHGVCMARRIFVFDAPDRFVCGTVGPPGRRVFFIQAVEGERVASVKLEKVQVAVLAQRFGQILLELQRRGTIDEAVEIGVEIGVDIGVDDPPGDDDLPLSEPLRDEFTVETLTIAWDGEQSAIVVEARSENPDADEDEDEVEEEEELDDDDPAGPDVLRVRLSAEMALGFVRRSSRILSAGRPPCPFCGQPLNPEGHLCPRRNGYLN